MEKGKENENENIKRHKNNLKSLIIKLSWQIANDNLSSLKGFTCGNFVFKFEMNSKKDMEDFVEFLKEKDFVMPWDICNFFLKKNIYFNLSYKYDKYNTIKNNIILYKTYIFLKKELKKIYNDK